MASVSSSRDKAARSPKCARCRNHGLVVQIKGHAGNCSFSKCTCWKCSLISERTRIMATQRRIKRGQRVHEESRPERVHGKPRPSSAGPAEVVTRSSGQRAEAAVKSNTELEPPMNGARPPPTLEPPNPRELMNTSQHYLYYWRSSEETGDRPPLLWECALPETLQKSICPGDKMAMPLPFQLYSHPNAYMCPAFLMTSPPVGTISFPHVPPGALMQWPEPAAPQEGPEFLYAPYASYPWVREGCSAHPDHYQTKSASLTAAERPPPPKGCDPGPDEGMRGREFVTVDAFPPRVTE